MKKIIFNNIRFINLNHKEFHKVISKNGLFVFPSAPGIASIKEKTKYYNSLKQADYVFFDSSLFVLLLKIMKNTKCIRFSGFKFLKFFFKYLKKNNNTSIFLIDPNKNYSKSNFKFINKICINSKKIHNYIAPIYNSDNLNDLKLLKEINRYKPKVILINIGGGTQEILGLYLKQKLNFKCKIICTGAAISFFTKDQAPINDFIDKLYLGWFVRLIYNPFSFSKRLFYALKLVKIVLEGKVRQSYT